MILLEITDSPDKNVLNKFEFFQNQLYLGRNSVSLNINDPSLLDSHVMIEVVEKDLILHPQNGVESYLIDGKRSSTIRKIKASQIITIGSTSFKVLNFQETDFKTKKSILDEKLNKLIEENSPRLAVIEKLGKMMK
jgi:hypothetical protein